MQSQIPFNFVKMGVYCMFPTEYHIHDFIISPYKNHNSDDYFEMVLSQWHVLRPEAIEFSDETEKIKYEFQYKEFKNYILKSVRDDIKSGKYRDYSIQKDGIICGIVDVGTEKFEYPEVGIILKNEFRGKGCGYLIMSDFIEKIKKNFKSDKVIWRTEPNNISAIMLALKLGGRESFETDNLKGFLI